MGLSKGDRIHLVPPPHAQGGQGFTHKPLISVFSVSLLLDFAPDGPRVSCGRAREGSDMQLGDVLPAAALRTEPGGGWAVTSGHFQIIMVY